MSESKHEKAIARAAQIGWEEAEGTPHTAYRSWDELPQFVRAGRIKLARKHIEAYAADFPAAPDDLLEALKHATAIIREHVPIEALGIQTDRGASWPLLAEYLHHFDAAIAKAEGVS